MQKSFIYAPQSLRFTQGFRFAQPFSLTLWDTWETRVQMPPLPPLFPKLQNCTAEN